MSDIYTEQRRYRVTELVGSGGFGSVYRARLEGADDFHKDVAIKLIHPDAPETLLGRFRDEARILGRIRNRAIVTADVPTRLNGRWAIVMEYVDGVSAEHLLELWGKVPPRVALDVVQEVAWALAGITEERQGSLRKLIHRDLKPANLQVTPTGAVKILDFGIARAEFEERESATTDRIAGSPGYIAPERFAGEELSAGDIWSLGVVLHQLVMGEQPNGRDTFDWEVSTTEDPLAEVLTLAAWMREYDPHDRPTARKVEERCDALHAHYPGPRLVDWAPTHVPPSPPRVTDDLVGDVLTETLSAMPLPPAAIPENPRLVGRRGSVALAAATGGTVTAVALAATLTVGGVLGLMGWSMVGSPSIDSESVDAPPSDPVASAEEIEESAPVAASPVEPRSSTETRPSRRATALNAEEQRAEPVPRPLAESEPIRKAEPEAIEPESAVEQRTETTAPRLIIYGDFPSVKARVDGEFFGPFRKIPGQPLDVPLPPGTAMLFVDWEGDYAGSGSVSIVADATATLNCDAVRQTCLKQ